MSAAPPLDWLVPDYVKAFTAYVPSRPDDELKRLYKIDRLYRLNNNENPLGPPPAAAAALAATPPASLAVYPSGDCYHLRHRIAAVCGVGADQVLVGNGANEVIAFAINAFCEQGDSIVTGDRTFAVYEWVATFTGIEARLAPLRDWAFDPQAMLDAIGERTKIVFICNPNNPTGTYWSRAVLEAFLDRIGGRQIVVLDEAYGEFVTKPDFPDGISMIERHPNLVVFRTFSKMYGLANLRIGYMVGSAAVMEVVRRTCVVYSVNGIAQSAALAAYGDVAHVARTNAVVAESRRFVVEALEGLGVSFLANEANYIMLRLPMSDTLAHRRLMAAGVMVRAMTGFRYPNYIRVSLALPEAMERFVEGVAGLVRR